MNASSKGTALIENETDREKTMSYTHLNAPTQFIERGGVRYAYRRFGAESGTPILFLQHFRGGLDHWDPAITDGLAASHPVILFNNAGVASSSGAPSDSVAGMAGHVIAFLEALGLSKVDLLGFSLGGFVAQQVVIDRSDLIRRVVLAGTGPQGGERMVEYSAEANKHATAPEPAIEDFLYLFFGPSKTSQAAGRAFWDRRHRRANQDIPSSVAAMQAQGAAIAAWGTVPPTGRYELLRKIEQPVLIVNGKNDIMVPTINSFHLQQNIPSATLIVYPDSGHGALFQFPDLFVAQVTTFLAG